MSEDAHSTKDEVARARAEKARKFGEVTTAAARRAGYKLDSPRGGGKKKLAEDAGMSFSSTSRMLSGQAIPDPKFFPGLSKALKMSLPELLIESTLAPPNSLITTVAPSGRLTPAEAAVRIGLQRPSNIEIFESFANTLLNQEAAEGLIALDKD